ncbi:hypothetical protein AVEN_136105-1 [Araneus ventricosus]|uniref:Uncharacterized protein n=1 Tax=Araneus ventricosus TaxID=182803 RepID=A0A4Y2IUJ4_ARAVE|nr:hypothetical protein AVEN_229083-1 [Araneus ventricosus]GBM81551.1 hypothetical protein AVEN_127696-1 [Araneus ventricosus]GBM81554.1 hypothetical protein AVEN_135141-1 [Araneus ventricosus]GBM81560.1 hypothetical protein AVEN_136105-1 [Araneus ventricosus]
MPYKLTDGARSGQTTHVEGVPRLVNGVPGPVEDDAEPDGVRPVPVRVQDDNHVEVGYGDVHVQGTHLAHVVAHVGRLLPHVTRRDYVIAENERIHYLQPSITLITILKILIKNFI